MPPDGADDTIRLPPGRRVLPAMEAGPPAPRRRRGWRLGLGLALLGGSVLIAGVALLRPELRRDTAPPVATAPKPPTGPAPPMAPAATAPGLVLPLANEAEILANDRPELVIRRFAANPDIVVLDFPSLGEQARMLNRVAALVEKAGLPRDRVLTDDELAAAERAGGGSAETFYYGHNYRAADLARFFALADAAGLRLSAGEERLRRLLQDLGWLRPGATGALISLPQAGAEPWLDHRARAAILRHELAHGEFFTRAEHAAAARLFWRELLSGAERERFRALLAGAGYDPALEEVMANEAHAFLFFTPDDRFFTAASVGMDAMRVAALRAAFLAVLPPGWARAVLAAP